MYRLRIHGNLIVGPTRSTSINQALTKMFVKRIPNQHIGSKTDQIYLASFSGMMMAASIFQLAIELSTMT